MESRGQYYKNFLWVIYAAGGVFPYDFDWGFTDSDIIMPKKGFITLATGSTALGQGNGAHTFYKCVLPAPDPGTHRWRGDRWERRSPRRTPGSCRPWREPEVNFIKLFSSSPTMRRNKLERWYLERLSSLVWYLLVRVEPTRVEHLSSLVSCP